MKKVRTMQFNMALNFIRTLFTTIFPLISFKYITNVLSQESIGKINYGNSIVQYFLILAGLGISTYATRECAKVRDNSKKINVLGSELFTINIISMICSYLAMLIIIFSLPKLNDYRILIFIQSVVIFFTTIGADWVNIVYEDYIYITFRTIIIQIVSLLLMVLFVKKPDDYIIYAIISSLSTAITNFSNWIYIKKYIKLKLTLSYTLLKHIKSIVLIFFVNIAISIYVNSDLTMLGYMKNDVDVGIYTVATKVYSSAKTLLAAVISVTIPRLSYNYEHNKKEYFINLEAILSLIIFIAFPIIIGIFTIPEFLIQILSSSEYSESIIPVRLLDLALLPTMLSTIVNNNILIAQRKEKYVLFSTCFAALINIIMNVILIPKYSYVATGMTTLFAEISVMIICLIQARHTLIKLNVINLLKDIIKVTLGCVYIVAVYFILVNCLTKTIYFYVLYILISVIGYLVIQKIFNHRGLQLFNFNNK